MTREEAIQRFNGIINAMSISIAQSKFYPSKAELNELCDMAIEALSAERTGEWIESEIPNELYVCSNCGGACWYYDHERDICKSNYCPNCGTKMTENKDNAVDMMEIVRCKAWG